MPKEPPNTLQPLCDQWIKKAAEARAHAEEILGKLERELGLVNSRRDPKRDEFVAELAECFMEATPKKQPR
jgi:hypothetical protein